MPSRRREFFPGAPVHLTANGVDDEPIFRTDFDRFALLALLAKVTRRVDWQVAAWCLMDTHYHLVLAPGTDLRVAWAMQTLNGVYAREFNHRYGRRGTSLPRAVHAHRDRLARPSRGRPRLRARQPRPRGARPHRPRLALVGA